jgi:hypothetical protein
MDFKSISGTFVGYYEHSKAYRVWNPRTRKVIKCRDVIFDELGHLERVTLGSPDLVEGGARL